MNKALFSKINDEVKIREYFIGLKTDQHEIRSNMFFSVNIIAKLNF